MNQFYFLIILLFTLSFISCNQVVVSEKKWDKEWSKGEWNYLETNAIERSRIAVIGGVLSQTYSHKNATVLDIGCGEGAISDFLIPSQRLNYVGLDISKEAILLAKSKRGHPMKFVHSSAHLFEPAHKFDVIIFSEVLYYLEFEKILTQYANFLSSTGIIIISIFRQTDTQLYQDIFNYAREKFQIIDEIDMSGFMKKTPTGPKLKTGLKIEVFKLKGSM